ncbi:PAAR domain-containing protein [Tenacibaculum sp. 1_MG-2023]|uniref:HET-C-related protein n=1 Tax=Tenacibaculum sp. 1_MG-2023 TaxID=3062653 RepID=UPI0026E18EB6|nr:HET-C-related protein [Tenacibaculum sp. 1_MG-2023]MDO6676162.1 PAAR domain-containing protein [Tenacibaculum sp. 1_MG-2023]
MSGKPVAVLGSNHQCPMCSGSTPHVGGPITKGESNVLVNGKPVATIGSACTCSGPPDVVVTGAPNILVNGKPVAAVGDMTAHGGVIISGETNVIISSGTITPPKVAASIEHIPFPTITIKDRLGASVTGNSKKLKEAEKNQEKIKKLAEETQEEKREITLTTTYPLDELNEYAKQFGASFFMYAMQAIFGESAQGKDLPLHAFDYLYRDLSEQKVEMPEIKIHTGKHPEAKYKSSENTIWIAQYLIIKATEEKDIEAMGKLFHAIMEEFGHFIDWQLRNHYTTLGGDAKLDEGAIFGYCLTTFNIFEEDTINFGTATVDGTTYKLKIELTEIKQQINELVTQERIKRDEQQDDEEYFSAGKKTLKQAGGFTHYGIERILFENQIVKNETDLNYIYLGNLLRDWSQLITPSTERYTKDQKDCIAESLGLTNEEKKTFFGLEFLNPIKLSRKHLSFVIELIACHELVGDELKKEQIGSGSGDKWIDVNPKKVTDTVAEATSDSASIKQWIVSKSEDLGIKAIKFSAEYYIFNKYFPKITSDLIGVYRPEEHIDNPMGACVVDLEKNEFLYWPTNVDPGINNHFGMKNYIRNYDPEKNKNEAFKTTENGVKPQTQKLTTASAYLTTQLQKSFAAHKQGNKKLSLLHFGNAMHTIEDYFAHSNFVELSLIKLGYSEVIPWVNRNDPKAKTFNKTPRTVDTFDDRAPLENYFDSKTKIGDYNLDTLYTTYPEAKKPILKNKHSFLFEKGGAAYEFIYKKLTIPLSGELHILRGATYIKDKKRAGDYINHLPIVTGKFGPLDMIHSLSDKIEGMFKTKSFSWKDAISSEWEGKPVVRIVDLLVLTVLTDLKYAQETEDPKNKKHKGVSYATIIEFYEYVITFRGVVLGVLEKAKRGKGWGAVGAWALIFMINSVEKALLNVVKKTIQNVIHGIAIGIRETQNLQKLDTNPTHTQIAKDEMDHPLHLLAGNLARIAVADIGRQYDNLKKGKTDLDNFINLSQEYLSHPADVDWMNVTTMKWASSHIGNIKNSENKGYLDAFQKKHHEHIKKLKEVNHKILEEISEGIEELKKLYEKAKDMEEDLEISKTIDEQLNNIKKLFK